MSTANTGAMRIGFFGEAMAELSLGGDDTVPASLGFAGDTMNTAIYLKRLMAEQADVSYITVLGKDPLSDRLIASLENESIDTSSIERHEDRLVGLYAITTDNEGERTFSYWRSNSAARTLFKSGDTCCFDVLSGFDVLYFSAISLAILPADVRALLLSTLADLRKQHQVSIIFDSNYRPALWESNEVAQQSVAAAWQLTDIALPSVDDEQNLFGDSDEASLIARLQSYGIGQGALKRGEKGPLSLRPEDLSLGNEANEPATWKNDPVSVVDTTAAGDSFNAGYISAILRDDSQPLALQAGHACASRVIAHRGAIIPKEDW